MYSNPICEGINTVEWLVEITLENWLPDLPTGGRIVGYEEVLAPSEYYAKHAGLTQFLSKCKYSPVTRLRMHKLGLKETDVRASDAVQI